MAVIESCKLSVAVLEQKTTLCVTVCGTIENHIEVSAATESTATQANSSERSELLGVDAVLLLPALAVPLGLGTPLATDERCPEETVERVQVLPTHSLTPVGSSSSDHLENLVREKLV